MASTARDTRHWLRGGRRPDASIATARPISNGRSQQPLQEGSQRFEYPHGVDAEPQRAQAGFSGMRAGRWRHPGYISTNECLEGNNGHELLPRSVVLVPVGHRRGHAIEGR
jgi:hypothetical protein